MNSNEILISETLWGTVRAKFILLKDESNSNTKIYGLSFFKKKYAWRGFHGEAPDEFWNTKYSALSLLGIYRNNNVHYCWAIRLWDINFAISCFNFLGLSAYRSRSMISTFRKSIG